MALQETAIWCLTSAFRPTGLVGREKFGLCLAGEHILLSICLAIVTLVFDIAALYQYVRTISQLMTQIVAIKVLWV